MIKLKCERCGKEAIEHSSSFRTDGTEKGGIYKITYICEYCKIHFNIDYMNIEKEKISKYGIFK